MPWLPGDLLVAGAGWVEADALHGLLAQARLSVTQGPLRCVSSPALMITACYAGLAAM